MSREFSTSVEDCCPPTLSGWSLDEGSVVVVHIRVDGGRLRSLGHFADVGAVHSLVEVVAEDENGNTSILARRALEVAT
ncbi:MAG: hypothetical protein HYV07_16835 [Deltaproteobacteria bacterium]|nr:hypothetical protein [Deltaproteobacteria bacterium]